MDWETELKKYQEMHGQQVRALGEAQANAVRIEGIMAFINEQIKNEQTKGEKENGGTNSGRDTKQDLRRNKRGDKNQS